MSFRAGVLFKRKMAFYFFTLEQNYCLVFFAFAYNRLVNCVLFCD
jgi:hypothetical protein